MEEQPAGNEPELKRPDEAIKDLELEEQAAEDVRGGGNPIYIKVDL
jgi:hypothetical protein